jgi:membrane protein YqaA with SNARE-associated domain
MNEIQAETREPAAPRPGILRRLYDWVLHWAETPYGLPALFILAFAESSFFPIPPDVLLIALAISIPKRSFWYALNCSIASVLGGALGYFIGLKLMNIIGIPIINFYGLTDQFVIIKDWFGRYGAWAVGVAGFTPIPYKIFTIAAGATQINFTAFLLASALSRSARFFIVAGLIYLFGEPAKGFIDKHFNPLAIIFIILLILGFIALKWII